MIPKIILIFIAGLIIDLLTTLYTKKVADKKLWPATFLSGLITLTNFALLTMIIKESDSNTFLNILAYAGGNTIGTYIALRKG
jgi:hypothetical protein